MKKLILAAVAALSVGLASAAVNINTATEQELTALPGIGAAKAKAIVAYREKNGAFKSVDELDNVKGIGPKLLEKLKPEASVSDLPKNQTQKAVPARKIEK